MRFSPKLPSFHLFLPILTLLVLACGAETGPKAPSSPDLVLKEVSSKATSSGPGLSSVEIFSRVSPSIAYIQTPVGTGSGVLVEGGFVVTNAHVVWPFREARVVFPDGSEFIGAPVFNSDLMGDLAVIGPIQTEVDPLPLMDGEDISIGSDLFLIGYPAELEDFPQPTITRGILSRLREWESIGITYLQTDASIAGGQSGGVLVSQHGEVVGISGFAFSEALFGLAASTADVGPRVARLIDGDDISGLGERNILSDGGRRNYVMEWTGRPLVINEPAGTAVEIKVNRGLFTLLDVFGEQLIGTDEEPYGVRTGSATTRMDAPYFVLLIPTGGGNRPINIESNQKMVLYDDPDDDKRVWIGRTMCS